jgi:hypothetical protein
MHVNHSINVYAVSILAWRAPISASGVMGETWHVAVLATKAGQTIAEKQFSVTSEGGM